MRKLYTLGAVIFFSLVLLSCEKKVNLDESPDFMILPLFEGHRLSTQELNQAQLIYSHLGVDRQVKDFKRATSQFAQNGVLASKDVIVLSAVENIKQFHLNIPGYESITLIIDAELLEEKKATSESCYCDKPLRSVMGFDGPLIKYSTDHKGATIYQVNMEPF